MGQHVMTPDFNGFTSKWSEDRSRMRAAGLDLATVRAIVQRHGSKALQELATLAGSGNYNRYIPHLEALRPAAVTTLSPVRPHAANDLPLFAN
jgi:hypothetical protein